MRTSSRSRPAGAKVEKRFLFFHGALLAPSFARALLDARAPNQHIGLASADQGHPRAALDTNDLWIRSLGAQHPVQSYGQLARRCHLGHSLGLLMTAMQILFTKSGIVTHCHL